MYAVFHWVEVPAGLSASQKVVGFMQLESGQTSSVSNDDIETAQSIVPLVAQIPYLDLALSDFFQAMTYQQHALIFLARAIESIENRFSGLARDRKGVGKEKVMQDSLGIKRSDVDYVTRRANESHRRHATSNGAVEALSPDELAECFKKTSAIIAAFVTFLRQAGLSENGTVEDDE